MKLLLPLLLLALAVGALWLSRRLRRGPAPTHERVDPHEIARTATRFVTSSSSAAVLEEIVRSTLENPPRSRPARRHVVARRDARSVEIAQRLVEHPSAQDVVRILVEVDPAAEGTAGRFEVLSITTTAGLLDRLAAVAQLRDDVLRSVSRLDPGAVFDDELPDLHED